MSHGNLAQAARLLGLRRTTLYSRMQASERGGD
jgi:transcriptional regulator of acetoin/glycerol metabolism